MSGTTHLSMDRCRLQPDSLIKIDDEQVTITFNRGNGDALWGTEDAD